MIIMFVLSMLSPFIFYIASLLSLYKPNYTVGSVVECLTGDRGVAGLSHWRHCIMSLSKTH